MLAVFLPESIVQLRLDTTTSDDGNFSEMQQMSQVQNIFPVPGNCTADPINGFKLYHNELLLGGVYDVDINYSVDN